MIDEYADELSKQERIDANEKRSQQNEHAQQCILKVERLCLQHGVERRELNSLIETFFNEEHSVECLDYFTSLITEFIQAKGSCIT